MDTNGSTTLRSRFEVHCDDHVTEKKSVEVVPGLGIVPPRGQHKEERTLHPPLLPHVGDNDHGHAHRIALHLNRSDEP